MPSEVHSWNATSQTSLGFAHWTGALAFGLGVNGWLERALLLEATQNTNVTPNSYERRPQLKGAFAGYFQKHDVLLCPVIPFTAPPPGREEYVVNGEKVPSTHMMRVTVPFNLAGLPGLSVPFGFSSEQLPINTGADYPNPRKSTVDPQTGYRRYTTDQIPTAQIIRRFRNLDMPLNEIRAVLAAPDLRTRNGLIAAHLSRLEGNLARTQSAVASLRDLLQQPTSSPRFEHRSINATAAAAITQVVDVKDALSWYQGALGELYATLAAQHMHSAGPAGGIFSNALFSDARGEATIFVPCGGAVRPMGRVMPLVVPPIELATIMYVGAHTDIDLAYGALATYVAQHALAVEGPVREYYVVGPHDTADETAWRTEIGWPIFQTGASA